ncbi:hypothetical protein BT96DRAFT_923523 [Gymnopus androsaceus JB14]|uniref:Geranylgeranyl pyrophosphate synthetase n=1 Tax=Gymnopus androsaceus JB14 TaxID=1447944 RepID=A0A6A4H9T6_9AGAR|nr:hypothetical protein BT96DRAFT_923523 [Gymnopus androsaceus JB14]
MAYRTSRDLESNLEKPFLTIQIPVVSSDNIEEVRITDAVHIGSFDWIGSKEPRILVPGFPPEWQDKRTPCQLSPDSKIKIVDQGYRHLSYGSGGRDPSARLLPLALAIDLHAESQGKTFDWASVSIATDRNCLRKLLRWVNGKKGKSCEFRIDLQVLGRTVFFNRWEKRMSQWQAIPTYGHSFEACFTNRLGKDSIEHDRIIQYDLKGLRIIVGYEVDAYLSNDSTRIERTNTTASQVSPPIDIQVNQATTLQVIRGGYTVPQDSIMELTTRSLGSMNKVNYNWEEGFPQLFFSQTQHHYLGVHQNGNILEVRKTTTESPELRAREQGLQPSLRRLRKVLGEIHELAVREGGISLVCNAAGELKAYRRHTETTVLHDYLQRKYAHV